MNDYCAYPDCSLSFQHIHFDNSNAKGAIVEGVFATGSCYNPSHAALESQLAAAQTALEIERSNYNERFRECEGLRRDIGVHFDRITGLERQLAAHVQTIREREASLLQWVEANKWLRAQLENAEGELQDREADLRERDEQLAEVEKHSEIRRGYLDQICRELGTFTEWPDQLEAIRRLKEQLAKMREALAASKVGVERIRRYATNKRTLRVEIAQEALVISRTIDAALAKPTAEKEE
jgi:septal ring factor EnvC (AmiA/AmiB activator)